jgi:hypothetical protein
MYFSFVFIGGLMVINFLIFVGDVGNVGMSLALFIAFVPYYFTSISCEYMFILLVLFLVLFL